MTRHRLKSLDEALPLLQDLRGAANVKLDAPITLHQMVVHVAQSIECSMRGYPQMKSGLLRATVGPLVVGVFFMRGQMKHDHAAPVPGEPVIPAEGDLVPAWERLFAAIKSFSSFSEAPRDHFLFGRLTKAEYDRLHAMHIADHLSALRT